MKKTVKGRISSFQTLGTLDGPGVRFVAFLQGCPLRCACCHNPETWEIMGGNEYSAEEIVKKAERYKEYFGTDGGITLSGGEPLLQPEFTAEIFRLCREFGINTCLDTSGYRFDTEIEKILDYTDYCMLDIKYTDADAYKRYTGCEMDRPLQFLKLLNERKIPTVIRQVIIGGINDGEENIKRLGGIIGQYSCVEKTELLPFRKLCSEKYERLGIDFPFAEIPETDSRKIEALGKLLQG